MNTTSKKTQFSYLDEDDMVSNSATKVPTQQSVKAYVDTTAEGLHVLTPVHVASSAAMTIGASDTHWTYANGDSGVGATLTYQTDAASSDSAHTAFFDGQTLTGDSDETNSAAERVLVKNASDTSKNGIYYCSSAGSGSSKVVLTRATDFDSNTNIKLGDFAFCESGTANAGHGFVMTGSDGFTAKGEGTVGTHTIVFTQFSGLSETVAVNQGGTGQTSYTNGQLLIGNTTGNTLGKAALSGDVTMTNAGVVSLAGAQTNITSIYNAALKVGRDTHNQFDFATDNMIKVSVNAVDDEFRFAAGGAFHADADITSFSSTVASDKRLKTNIKKIEYGLKDVLQLRGVEFDWKEKRNGKHDIGFIAQEVQEIIPEVINEIPDLQDETNKYLGVDYSKIVPLLVESIKEQQQQIEDLRNEVDLLKKINY